MNKRDRIQEELRKDAGRSDREIARIVGCDHKTVGFYRRQQAGDCQVQADHEEFKIVPIAQWDAMCIAAGAFADAFMALQNPTARTYSLPKTADSEAVVLKRPIPRPKVPRPIERGSVARSSLREGSETLAPLKTVLVGTRRLIDYESFRIALRLDKVRDEPFTITVKSAVRRSGLSRATINRMIKRGSQV